MAEAPQSVVAQVRQLMQKDKTRQGNKWQEKIPLDEFVALLYEEGGSVYKLAKRIGMSATMASKRRALLERDLGIELPRGRVECWKSQANRARIDLAVDNATILIGSDLHAWPEIYGAAMAAFVDINRRLKPEIVILNGDGFDGAKVSRHARIGWEKRPDPAEEIQALSEYLDTVLKANPNARYIRTVGNHDIRLENYLSSNAPLVEGLKGTTLADHIPGWEECMAIRVNSPHLIVKHRGRHSGIHATFNELRRLGASFIHGHLHAQKLVSFENAHGSIYGVDLGMLAPVQGPQFGYTEDDICDWRSGFAVVTFVDGKMEIPELVTVVDEEEGKVRFRGQTLTYEI